MTIVYLALFLMITIPLLKLGLWLGSWAWKPILFIILSCIVMTKCAKDWVEENRPVPKEAPVQAQKERRLEE